jgi:hypothetical protein
MTRKKKITLEKKQSSKSSKSFLSFVYFFFTISSSLRGGNALQEIRFSPETRRTASGWKNVSPHGRICARARASPIHQKRRRCRDDDDARARGLPCGGAGESNGTCHPHTVKDADAAAAPTPSAAAAAASSVVIKGGEVWAALNSIRAARALPSSVLPVPG